MAFEKRDYGCAEMRISPRYFEGEDYSGLGSSKKFVVQGMVYPVVKWYRNGRKVLPMGTTTDYINLVSTFTMATPQPQDMLDMYSAPPVAKPTQGATTGSTPPPTQGGGRGAPNPKEGEAPMEEEVDEVFKLDFDSDEYAKQFWWEIETTINVVPNVYYLSSDRTIAKFVLTKVAPFRWRLGLP
jgi:hypothetical protein